MTDRLVHDVDATMQRSAEAFKAYKKVAGKKRAEFLTEIAAQLELNREELVTIAHEESNLPLPRLNGELTRTCNQLKMFAGLITEGSWVEAVIDKGDESRTPAKSDTRKMLQPVGPVVVFGASNFPFAFSTAGGDTASALAAGCSVVVKAHPAHVKTSTKVFDSIKQAATQTAMPEYILQHEIGAGNELGKTLVQHEITTAVGFTGSLHGGLALVGYANERRVPIPVFAEMGSVNPVVLLPDTLQLNAAALAQKYAASVTLGMGQFCTNPGLLLGIKSEGLEQFIQALGNEVAEVFPAKMLHKGISEAYNLGLIEKLSMQGVEVVGKSKLKAEELEGAPTITKVSGKIFLQNNQLQEELFGPYSLVVVCTDKTELIEVLQSVKGQLTTTVMATDKDLNEHRDLVELQTSLAGRIILNDVPTGVEVCASMVHGGPYPATTDARFTSVGTSAVKRWVRPVCYQGFTDGLLPDELKDNNPLGIWRLVDGSFKK
ncbi:aldehyde dehydrogenase (NADP(+)) [Chitinophagaceae bacterium LWZ2-11]